MSLYQITVENIAEQKVKIEAFKNKVLLIVNTATKCFFTPQYEALQSLYEKYQDRGFEVLDFPCNQFGKNAPEDIEDIDKFCVSKFKTTFPRFAKIEVNGPDENVLYTYLKRHQKGLFNRRIKWNFTKFLIDRNGKVIARYGPMVKIEKIARNIEKLL